MDEKMLALEERLSDLVPRALSEEGQQRLDEQIDSLAEEVESEAGSRSSQRGWWLVAACVLAGVGMFLVAWQEGTTPEKSMTDAPEPPGVELVTSTRKVMEITDSGWVLGDGTERPHRYWGFRLTDAEQVIDEESGYAVTILSEREEWIPVTLTQL